MTGGEGDEGRGMSLGIDWCVMGETQVTIYSPLALSLHRGERGDGGRDGRGRGEGRLNSITTHKQATLIPLRKHYKKIRYICLFICSLLFLDQTH